MGGSIRDLSNDQLFQVGHKSATLTTAETVVSKLIILPTV